MSIPATSKVPLFRKVTPYGGSWTEACLPAWGLALSDQLIRSFGLLQYHCLLKWKIASSLRPRHSAPAPSNLGSSGQPQITQHLHKLHSLQCQTFVLTMANKTQICASLTAASLQEAAEQMQQAAAAGADLAELRLDLLGSEFDANKDLQQLLTAGSLPLILACRPSSLGCALLCHLLMQNI